MSKLVLLTFYDVLVYINSPYAHVTTNPLEIIRISCQSTTTASSYVDYIASVKVTLILYDAYLYGG